MSMHLEGPWLTTTGKRKGKRRHRNADSAAQARSNAAAWADLLQRHGIEPGKKTRPAWTELRPNTTVYRRETPAIPSVDTGQGQASAMPSKVYTGDAMLGVATMHKSNSVPVFSAREAADISQMRRN